MKTNGMKIVKELPENMTGHIVVFEEPLLIQTWKEDRSNHEIIPDENGERKHTKVEKIDKVVKCNFMRAEGGFGSYACCSGRMIIGKFFKSIQDVIDNKPIQDGNTKCYPSGYIPELFTKQEKL